MDGKYTWMPGTGLMTKTAKFIFGFFLAAILIDIAYSQERAINITFDDLPATHGNLEDMQYITSSLLKVLVEHQVPAIGFVNESKLYSNNSPNDSYIELLSSWLEAGMDLGNHTYSHIFIDNATIEEYKKDVLRGEIITRPLVEKYRKELIYFRHTQLRTGPTDEYKKELDDFLRKQKYTIAPVTIDNDEYIYAYCYKEAIKHGNNDEAEMIKKAYLEYMEGVFQFYESQSHEFLGYEPRQILLLHANLLNADAMNDLILMIKDRGYRFIALEKALTDSAYSLPEVQADKGISWLHRWMIAEGVQPKEQPAPSKWVINLFNQYSER